MRTANQIITFLNSLVTASAFTVLFLLVSEPKTLFLNASPLLVGLLAVVGSMLFSIASRNMFLPWYKQYLIKSFRGKEVGYLKSKIVECIKVNGYKLDHLIPYEGPDKEVINLKNLSRFISSWGEDELTKYILPHSEIIAVSMFEDDLDISGSKIRDLGDFGELHWRMKEPEFAQELINYSFHSFLDTGKK